LEWVHVNGWVDVEESSTGRVGEQVWTVLCGRTRRAPWGIGFDVADLRGENGRCGVIVSRS
jgi:hypothetical protein